MGEPWLLGRAACHCPPPSSLLVVLAWGRPVPGIPEPVLKEAAGWAGSSAPRALHPPATLGRPWENAMGPRALWTFLGGLRLLAGMQGLGQGEVWLAAPRRRLWCLWADWGQDSNPGGFFGPGLLQLGYGARAGLGCFMEPLAELGLGMVS